jgi:hypothetical protein
MSRKKRNFAVIGAVAAITVVLVIALAVRHNKSVVTEAIKIRNITAAERAGAENSFESATNYKRHGRTVQVGTYFTISLYQMKKSN